MIDTELLNKIYDKDKQSFITDVLDQNPRPATPIVTQTDATNGYLIRYFVRQVNDTSYVVEVDKKQYEQLKSNPRFVTTQIKWKIVGIKKTYTLNNGANLYGVEDQNRLTINNADLTFGGLSRYITNYLEYWVAEK